MCGIGLQPPRPLGRGLLLRRHDERLQVGEAGVAIGGEVAGLPPVANRIDKLSDPFPGRDAEGDDIAPSEWKAWRRPGVYQGEKLAAPSSGDRPVRRQQ